MNGNYYYDNKNGYIIVRRYDVDYTIPIECLTHNIEYELDKFVGSGIVSSVWGLKGNKLVIRIVPLDVTIIGPDCSVDDFLDGSLENCPIMSTDEFINNTKTAEILGKNSIGPKVIDWWICNNDKIMNEVQGQIALGFVVSERYDMSLEQYESSYPDKFIEYKFDIHKAIKRLMIKLFNKFKMCHGDLHEGNVLVNIDPNNFNVKKIRLTDFDTMIFCDLSQLKDELANIDEYF